MSHLPLEQQLALYRKGPFYWPEDEAALVQSEQFLKSHPDVFHRRHLVGHFTGSGLVFTPEGPPDGTGPQVALIHHRKLGMWIQLGGHADGNPDLAEVALREAEEESGLTSLSFFPDAPPLLPFDLDVMVVPARPEAPEHLHYDVRYLLLCPTALPIQANPEAHEVAWLSIEEAERRCQRAPTMMRQLAKLTGALGPR